MTALRRFTPPDETRTFQVTVLANRFDEDEGKFTVTVHAIGALSAREIAVDQVRDEYPSAMAVGCEEVVEPVADYLFHDECNYAWSRHDAAVPGRKLPWGCPTDELILWFGEGNR